MLLLLAVSAFTLRAFAAPTCANASLPSSGLQIFLDFDGTIVTSDAYTTLATAAYDSLPANSSVTSWDEIEETYGTVYDAVAATVPEPSSLSEAIAYANNQAFRAVEQWSFLWVQDLGIFNDIKETALLRQARNQTLRDGWCDFARTAQQHGNHISVASLNWSPSWIRLVLQDSSDCPEVVSSISTFCPEILPDGVLPHSDLDHNVPLFSGGDKTKLMNRILSKLPPQQKRNVLFVSDGDADLQSLLEAPTNIGVVAGFAESAAETLQKYDVQVWPASEGWKGHTGNAARNGSVIYGFEDWSDVKSLLWW